jgi:hypothetical protein
MVICTVASFFRGTGKKKEIEICHYFQNNPVVVGAGGKFFAKKKTHCDVDRISPWFAGRSSL